MCSCGSRNLQQNCYWEYHKLPKFYNRCTIEQKKQIHYLRFKNRRWNCI